MYILLFCCFQFAVNTNRSLTVANWAHMYMTFLTYYNHVSLNDGWGYILRNLSLGGFIVVRMSWSALTQT